MSYPISSSLLDGIVLAVVERESTYGYVSRRTYKRYWIFPNLRCIRYFGG